MGQMGPVMQYWYPACAAIFRNLSTPYIMSASPLCTLLMQISYADMPGPSETIEKGKSFPFHHHLQVQKNNGSILYPHWQLWGDQKNDWHNQLSQSFVAGGWVGSTPHGGPAGPGRTTWSSGTGVWPRSWQQWQGREGKRPGNWNDMEKHKNSVTAQFTFNTTKYTKISSMKWRKYLILYVAMLF